MPAVFRQLRPLGRRPTEGAETRLSPPTPEGTRQTERVQRYTRIMQTVPATHLLDRITIDPGVCHGKPCIRHLRYPVEMLLDLLSGGMTPEQILDDYHDLERDDILAALAYAARLSRVKSMDAGVS